MPSDVQVEAIVILGTDNLRPSVRERFMQTSSSRRLINTYGTSEALFISSQSYEDCYDDSVGTLLQRTEIMLSSSFNPTYIFDDSQPTLPSNRLSARTPYHIHKRRYEPMYPHEDFITIFDTGDLCHIDRSNKLWLQGRCKNIIVRMGENLSCEHIESHFGKSSFFQEYCIFGFFDGTGSSAVGLALTYSNALTEDIETGQLMTDIYLHFYEQTPSKYHPQKVLLVDELPRTSSGKVRRTKLASLLQEPGAVVFTKYDMMASFGGRDK